MTCWQAASDTAGRVIIMGWSVVSSNGDVRRAVLRLAGLLRARLEESEQTQAWLARRTGYSPTVISRALSGRVLPSQAAVLAISAVLGVGRDESSRMWNSAAEVHRARRREHRIAERGGWPPAVGSYSDLLDAVRRLLRTSHVTQTRIAARIGMPLSTLSAALRGTRSLHRGLLADIVYAWQVETGAVSRADTAMRQVDSWLEVWDRVGRPHQQEQWARRREGCQRSGEARRFGLAVTYERRRQHGAWLRDVEGVSRRRVRRRR
ncbi:helix-turn-helix domain-containing protein [Nonomuraea sp. NPDC050394]|uniref:helix-turn-helix domain-containing protein n=1 Tax=Nonomuraea sp. NPDC050394 TaxID=3364363 RepID=UPI0037A5C4A2